MQGDISRKDRLVTVAMSARAEVQTAYQDMKQNTADLERRFRETQVLNTFWNLNYCIWGAI